METHLRQAPSGRRSGGNAAGNEYNVSPGGNSVAIIQGEYAMDRRTFLKTSAATGLALSAGGMASAKFGKTYRAGLIGCGWYGMVDLRHLMGTGQVEVVALCDVDKKHL